MFSFLITTLVLLGLLVGIPLWSGTELEMPTVLAVALLAVAALVSAVLGRTRRD
jgi:hypothetical protein